MTISQLNKKDHLRSKNGLTLTKRYWVEPSQNLK